MPSASPTRASRACPHPSSPGPPDPLSSMARNVGSAGLAPAYGAARARLGLVAALFVVAGIGWWWTAQRMRGMDAGPWTTLGSIGWFLGIWVVMMAAMM